MCSADILSNQITLHRYSYDINYADNVKYMTFVDKLYTCVS